MMEELGIYLLKSVIWLAGFALIYILFLRNERFFELNRYFLISGILSALLMPLITVTYRVILPLPESNLSAVPVAATGQSVVHSGGFPHFHTILLFIYSAGLFLVVFRIIRHSRILVSAIRDAGKVESGNSKLIRTARFSSSFSFFSWIFVNPSVTDAEMKEIMNHELVHIRQKHWLDLMLAEVLCLVQWFNPVTWLYSRLIRQNHEYIADRMALQRTSDPFVYKAALLNQIVGAPVISLVNSFSYSNNKKRFIMMENIFSPPYRKLKLLLILPVFTLILFAFARPDYHYADQKGNQSAEDKVLQSDGNKVQGSIVEKSGKPLPGAHIILLNSTVGTTSDENGKFRLENVPAGSSIAISYVGFKSKVIKSEFVKGGPIIMDTDTITYFNDNMAPPPPPPPPPPPADGKMSPPPLVVIDGKISNKKVADIESETIQMITVLKDKYATDKYGEKGKNGVIEITMKKEGDRNAPSPSSGKQMSLDENTYVAVEELPSFPGGYPALSNWINKNLKNPLDANSKRIAGTVEVYFLVEASGRIKNVQVKNPVNPKLDAEAKRVVSGMPDWKPGTQNGKPVDVQMKLPVEFSVK